MGDLIRVKQVQFTIPTSINIGANERKTILDHFNIKTSEAEELNTKKTLAQLFGDKNIFAVIGIWVNGGLIIAECILWDDKQITIGAANYTSGAITATGVRLLVFYH